MSQVGQLSDTWPGGITATMNVTYTQANAAGGAVVCEITPGTGDEFILSAGSMINSGTNGLQGELETAAGGSPIALIAFSASGAGTLVRLPSIGSAATSTGNAANSTGLIVSGTQALKLFQTGAGAQNDTFTVRLNIRCHGEMPIVTHANSTNAANVSVTAGAESFAEL